MAEINKRNLVDETAKVYAANTLADEPTPLFSTGMPAKIIRASIANTNLLSKDGDLFVGTGDTCTETIDGTQYTYAKIIKQHKNQLFPTLGLWGASVPDDASNYTGYVAIGNGAKVTSAASIGGGIAIGGTSQRFPGGTEANGGLDVAIGNGARTSSYSAIALGRGSLVEKAVKGIAIGYSATVQPTPEGDNCDNSIAIGQNTRVTASNAILLGEGINATKNSFQVKNYQMLDLSTGKIPLNRINQAGSTTALAIGGSVGGTVGSEDTVYGIGAKASTNIKWFAMNGTAIGAGVEAVDSGDMAIGYKAYCKGGNNIAIGYQAKVGVADNDHNLTDCIAIGNEAIVSQKNQALNKSIQLGKGINLNGGLKVFDWQLLNWQGKIPTDRFTLQYQHNLTLSAMSNGIQLFYLSFSIITSSEVSLSNNYGGQSAVVFLENLADILSKNGYSDSGRFRCPCTGYDVANTSQMMWLSGNGSTIKYYYVQNNSIQSRELSIGSTNTGIYVDDKVFAGF